MKHVQEPPATVLTSPYTPLIIQYALMTIYGIGSSIQGVATLDAVTGDLYGVIWPILVAVTSLTALVGVIVSRATNRHKIEIVATLGLVLLLVSYVVAIIVRAASDHTYTGLPFAVLPLALCVFPYVGLLRMVRGKLAR